MEHEQGSTATVDLLTVAGLSLLILPLLTMAHEVGGHAATCVGLGGQVTELGAYYVNCKSRTEELSRLVAIAGTGADLLVCALAFFLWKRAKSDLMRLVWWLTFVGKAMAAAGYLLFSGISGVGDWGPTANGGIGPLPHAELIRIILIAGGFGAYFAVVRLGKRTLTEMVGGAPGAALNKRTIALGHYFVSGIAALLIGAMNPKGLLVLIFSAVASSFGSNAGMISIAQDRTAGEVRAFRIERNLPMLVAGLIATLLFAVFLGPTIRLN
jgi:hypothetical protein